MSLLRLQHDVCAAIEGTLWLVSCADTPAYSVNGKDMIMDTC